MNKIDNLLTLFCYDKEPACDREWCRKPMYYRVSVYATNREISIRVPDTLCGSVYSPAMFPDGCKTFYDLESEFQPLSEPVIIPLSFVTEVLSGIEKVTGYKDCPDCNGVGQVDDDNDIVDCVPCLGIGTVEYPGTLVWPEPYKAVIKLSNTFFSVKYIALLETVCNTLECDHVTIAACTTNKWCKCLMFQIGEATVMIAALLHTEGEETGPAKVYEIRLPQLQKV